MLVASLSSVGRAERAGLGPIRVKLDLTEEYPSARELLRLGATADQP
jgi:hypothetical protein